MKDMAVKQNAPDEMYNDDSTPEIRAWIYWSRTKM
jgi:hypothetical protein